MNEGIDKEFVREYYKGIFDKHPQVSRDALRQIG